MLILASAPSGFDSVVTSINDPVSAFAWGWPTVGLISFTGILLMLGLRFMPILRLPYGVRMMLAEPDQRAEGDITSFQALMTSLAATSAPATSPAWQGRSPSVDQELCSGCG